MAETGHTNVELAAELNRHEARSNPRERFWGSDWREIDVITAQLKPRAGN
ncbi:MAG: hypothetical protein WBQ89_11530 [Candidatus Acidiferrum sp.]